MDLWWSGWRSGGGEATRVDVQTEGGGGGLLLLRLVLGRRAKL